MRPAKGPGHARAKDDSLDADSALRAAIADPENTVDDGEVYVAWAEGKPFGP